MKAVRDLARLTHLAGVTIAIAQHERDIARSRQRLARLLDTRDRLLIEHTVAEASEGPKVPAYLVRAHEAIEATRRG